MRLALPLLIAAAAGCGEPRAPSPAASGSGSGDPYYITCDDVLLWRADYEEINEAVLYEDPGAMIPDPSPTQWLGRRTDELPDGYEYDDHLIAVNLYWDPDAPDAGVYVDAANPDAYLADATVADAGSDAGLDAGGLDAGGVPDAGWYVDAAPADGGWSHDAAVATDGGLHVRDASIAIFFGPPGQGGKPVEPRPQIAPKPPGTTPVTQIPLPPGASKPPPIKVEPQGAKTAAAATAPRFTDPVAKLADTAHPDFRAQLWTDLNLLDPAFGARNTEVHMGMWSGKGNRTALLKLLNDVNTNGGPRTRAFFDEGVSDTQLLPAYRTMNAEAWYGRAKLPGGKGSIDGGAKVIDPKPVNFAQADRIWGQYSQRYAQMAIDANSATGKIVDVWCYVEGAASDRVFYKYELPVLRDLETLGVVRVHFAKTQNARYNQPNDWIHGTANAPMPQPPVNPPPLGPP